MRACFAVWKADHLPATQGVSFENVGYYMPYSEFLKSGTRTLLVGKNNQSEGAMPTEVPSIAFCHRKPFQNRCYSAKSVAALHF